MTKRYLWTTLREDSFGHFAYGESGSAFYRQGNQIMFQYIDFDRENLRAYHYYGAWYLDVFRAALQEAEETGSAKIKDTQYLYVTSEQERFVCRLYGAPSPANTPGGASLSGSVPFSLDKKYLEKIISDD